MATHGDIRTAAVIAASVYRVDMSTLVRRLWELQHVSYVEAAQIRTFRTTRADIVEFNLVVGTSSKHRRCHVPMSKPCSGYTGMKPVSLLGR